MLVTEMDMPQSLKSNLARRQTEHLKHRASDSAEQLFNGLESVPFVAESSDLGSSEDCFEPTASCINDTNRRQLVTRSALSKE